MIARHARYFDLDEVTSSFDVFVCLSLCDLAMSERLNGEM